MTPSEIAEAQRLCDAATLGPWWNESGVIHAKNPGVWTEQNRSCIHPAYCPETYWLNASEDQQYDDAEFIAAARDLLPKALAHIQAQSEQLRQVQSLLLALRDGVDKHCPGGIPCSAETWDAIDTALSFIPAERVARMEAALRKYADSDNWGHIRMEEDEYLHAWRGDKHGLPWAGYEVARAALEGDG